MWRQDGNRVTSPGMPGVLRIERGEKDLPLESPAYTVISDIWPPECERMSF
jgi:hypothetical protein